ncbi:MAG: TRAP transporter substrate-binding protein DctP [Deltaproteobacteria bacterium]|nr:TRAP transporter substrate-binding protein DctP [Deltaproteobacteria bacterium]
MKKHAIWLFTLGLLTVVGIERYGEAQDAQVRSISIATLAPPGSTWMKVFDAWNREIRRRSNKTLQLRFYPGGVQGDEAEVIRKIRNGRVDGAAVTAVGLGQIHRPALVFEMPDILRNYDELDAARAALAPEMNAAFERAGFKMLGWADVGIGRLFSTMPIRTPADMARAHPWLWRDDLVMPAFFQVVRSNPVPLQVPEVLSALQTRRIDSLLATPVAAVALQWQSRVSYMTELSASIAIGGTIMGKRQWDSLTDEQRTILTETAAQFHALARRNLRRDEQQAIQSLGQNNIQVITPTAAQKEEWRRVATQVRQRLVGQICDQALIDRVLHFRH